MGSALYRNTHLDQVPEPEVSGGGLGSGLRSSDQSDHEGLPGSEDVLPTSVCIRSLGIVTGGAGARDIFRLFFYEGELCAATPFSPWAYYRDIYDHRDFILQSIREFCSKPALRDMIKVLCSRAKRRATTTRRGASAAIVAGQKEKEKKPAKLDLANYNTKPRTGDKPGGCLSLYVPPEEMLFGRRGFLYEPQLSESEVLDLHKEHPFLAKFDEWRGRVRSAQSSRLKAKKEADGDDDTPLPVEKAPLRKLAPLEQRDSEGAMIFAESNVRLPGGDRSVSEGDYLQSLSTKLAYTNTSISHRVCTPFHVETQHEVQPDSFDNYDLLVIEIAISVSDILERRTAALAKAAEGSMSKDAGIENGVLKPTGRKQAAAPIAGGLKSKKEREKADEKVVRCEIHQIIGFYSCGSDQPPATLDLGLVSWSHFRQLLQESERTGAVGIVNAGDPMKLVVASNQRDWTHANEQSGVSTYRCPLSSGRSGNFVFSILAAKPDVPYLLANLTKKVKRLIKLEEED